MEKMQKTGKFIICVAAMVLLIAGISVAVATIKGKPNIDMLRRYM